MRSILSAVTLLATLLSSSCSSSREAGTPPTSLRPDKPLLNTYWVLQKIGTTATPTEANALPLSLLLKIETTNVQGNAGCNRFRGNYTRTGSDQLTFSQLITTKMSCPQASTESSYLQALGATASYRIQGDTLRLFGSQPGVTLAQFSAEIQ